MKKRFNPKFRFLCDYDSQVKNTCKHLMENIGTILYMPEYWNGGAVCQGNRYSQYPRNEHLLIIFSNTRWRQSVASGTGDGISIVQYCIHIVLFLHLDKELNKKSPKRTKII